MNEFVPEGTLIDTSKNNYFLSNLSNLKEAQKSNAIIEANAIKCTKNHNLIVDLGFMTGVIKREECSINIKDDLSKDIAILSKVNKPVCFKVIGFEEDNNNIVPILSRKLVQQECINNYVYSLEKGDIINVVIVHFEPFGCFVDIGCGICSLLPIDCMSFSRISSPKDRFSIGQNIKVIVKDIDKSINRVYISHKELLGTWEENANLFEEGDTVVGTVRSIMPYGIFVELTPNLSGLAELQENVKVGETAIVYIKSIVSETMKFKLNILDHYKENLSPKKPKYFVNTNHISDWVYSTK